VPKELSKRHHIKPVIVKPDANNAAVEDSALKNLKKAGLNPAEARKLEIPVEKRRKTAHDQSVEVIKAYAVKKKAEVKPNKKLQPEKKAKK
jgi:ribosomal protein L13E